MKKLHSFLWSVGVAATMLTTAPATAQNILPAESAPMILTPTEQTISYRERTLCYNITANVEFKVETACDWISLRRGMGGEVYIHLSQNMSPASRTGELVFTSNDGSVTKKMLVTQTRDESVETLPTDIKVQAKSVTANTNQSGNDITKTIDGQYDTFWHSQWTGNAFKVSENNPAVLTYTFEDVDYIDYINYVPRQDGTANGYFGEVEVLVKKVGESDYTSMGRKDFKQTAGAKKFKFDAPVENPASIQMKVYGGSGGFATCAEMEFCQNAAQVDNVFDFFEDEVCSVLKPGITQEDIDAIKNPFTKSLVSQIYAGNYRKDYRVAEYKCYLDPTVLALRWNTEGKRYNQYEGATGISVSKGKHAVIVSGIPDGESLRLRVCAWYVGKVGENFDGGDPVTVDFTLENGINVIEYKNDWPGLAYVCYYTDDAPSTKPNVKVHFVNGEINGYLSPDKTNEEMHELCKNAPNYCMDAVGSLVHSVWTSQGFYKYCKASDGKSIGYRQFMNVLDSLVQWEHDLLGFEKYGLLETPQNRTFAYVNFTYYMFQGGAGVSFHQNQESRVLNCKNLMYNDNDAIWGLSHEWGHQHQMHPYFCWGGLGEVSNNMNSYYNIMHMGYTESDKINQWDPARKHFVNVSSDYTPYEKSSFTETKVYAPARQDAAQLANDYSYSPKLKALCEEMGEYTEKGSIPTQEENVVKALGHTEVGVGEMLCPYIMLYNYATYELGIAEFGPMLYESLRKTDAPEGSSIEKTSGLDKYELIAATQNGNKNNGLATLKKQYPTSCWVVDKYLCEGHTNTWENSTPYVLNFIRKTSRLTGYNLFPYYERWGYLRQLATFVGDYGHKPNLLTKEMYDEFKADMDALVESGELKAMPEGMVEAISNYRDLNLPGDKMFPTPNIPN